MHGNVDEWCLDWHATYPGTPVTDPTGTPTGSMRVLRSGDWASYAGYIRSAVRDGGDPRGQSLIIGFRVVLVAVP